MEKYIPLNALVAEIERRYKLVDKYETNEFCAVASRDELVHLMNFVNTLEAKEVDLEKEIEKCLKRHSMLAVGKKDFTDIAKYFFELGMCAANPLTVKDIKKIYHLVNEVSDDLGVRAMYVNIYKETLKRFKAQKGE